MNAALYQIAQSSNYTNDFHSITTGNNGYYPAEPGLNDATGLGSFNGVNLYNDLVNNYGAEKIPSVPSYVEAFPGNSQVYISGSDFNNEGITSYNVKRSLISGGPYTTIGALTDFSSGFYIDSSVVNGTTYYYVFSAVNSAGESPNSLEVNAMPSFLPPAPQGLNVRVGGTTLLELNWNFGYDTPSLSFNVKRSTVPGGPYTTIATLPHLWSDIYYGYWDQTVVPGNTYYYVVSAVTPTGEGPNSAQASATPTSSTQTETITASAGTGGAISPSGNVSVNYGANQTFTVTPNAGYTPTLTVDGSAVTLTNNSYTLNNVIAAHTVAANFSLSLQTGIPTAPAGLSATDIVGEVILTWSPDTGATSYNVKRSTTNGGPYSTVKTVTSTTAIDLTVIDSTTYYYVVSAVNSSGESPNSSQVSATAMLPVPAVPVSLSSTSGQGQVALTWNQDQGAATYNVKRSTASGGPYTTIQNLATTSAIDTSVNNGTTYYYVVSAVNSGGESANSAQVSATPLAPTYAITASAGPGGAISPSETVSVNYGASQTFTVTPNTGYTASLKVDGTAVTLTNNTYILSNVTATHTLSATFTQITNSITASAGSNGSITPTSVTVAYGGSQVFTLTPKIGYAASLTVDGRAVALINNTYTLINVTASHTLSAAFTQITYSIKATAGSNGSISPSGANTVNYGSSEVFTMRPNAGYQIVSVMVNGTALKTMSSNYTFSDVTANETICVTFAQMLPAIPAGLEASAGNAQVVLTWSATTGAASYNVKRATVNGGPYTMIASGLTNTTYKNTSLANGITYYYVVSAVNAAGQGPNSLQVRVRPE